MAEGGCRDKLFVDKHRGELIQRVNNTAAILAELVSENVIQQDSYDKIRALPTPQQIMRELFSGPLASSGVQGKETLYKILNKHESYLIDDLKRTEYENAMKVEAISSVIELLLETLAGLSDWELEEFKSFLLSQTCIYEHFSNIQWRLLRTADMQDTVFSMVQNDGQQSVETTKEVLEKMKRTDLVQMLSDSSSGSKKKHSVDEHLSALIHKVATMRAIKERLLETLSDLSDKELEKFKWLLQFTFFQRSLELISWREVQWTYNVNELVDVMVEKFGQQSVEVTVEVLMDMNRSDLMQKLSETISGHKEKHCMDEHCPALVQMVEMMTSVIELLLETLASLSDRKLRKFRDILLSQTDFDRCISLIPLILLEIEDWQVTVFLMVQTYGQQSVETTKEVLEKMKRTDLVQRLSDSSKGPKNEHQSALIQKVATMAAVKQLLLETLNDLSDKELKKFKWSLEWIVSQKDLPDVSPEFGLTNDRAEMVDVMLQTYSQQSVPLTREVVKKMNRIDLMQRLSKPSSELEEAHSVDEHVPAVLKKAAVKLILLETLKDLSKKEIEKFKWLLRFTQFQKGLPHVSLSGLQGADSTDTLVDLMVQTCGQQSVEVTTEVFMDMDRTDLVKRLSIISSRIKEKQPSELLQKEVTMTPLMEKLLETLEDLSEWELRYFKHVLQCSRMKKSLPKISTQRLETASRIGMLKLMVDFDGQLSVEVTREVLMKMNRRDLAERLSKSSSGLKEVHQSEPLQKEVTKTPLMEKLLETLEDLSPGELEKFKQYTKMETDLTKIIRDLVEMADRAEIVELMVKIYGQQSVEVTSKVLKKMNRADLVEMLSEPSSGLKGPSRSLELEGCGSIMQDSSDWTEVEPEVNSTDADKASTYSLQSEAGNFECSVSGLRWVCKEKVSFKYQFCSSSGYLERIESMQYMAAGPLMDITVIAGKLDVVYLPHWICIDDNPTILDKFAVLHIDDCGDVVEKVSEVTSSHVKLSEPVFSPRAVLMKAGLLVKIRCNVLIYKTNTAFLTLHVYLIPCDPGLQQEMDKRELSRGYKIIQKPHPEKSLKMRDRFILTADLESADICPETLQLRHTNPNFFEVFIENPDKVFKLKLEQEKDHQPVWTCTVRKDDYQSSTGPLQGEHFVDKHQCELIKRVSNIGSILDNLLKEKVIQQEEYDAINALKTSQKKMRKLYSGALKAAGHDGKDVFYKVLEENETYLVADLKRKES
ncbi:uncharacterized protein LOC126392119 isoform X8 [Epinephelus moara]|uniref:uncharacterized protein LOC126392119 isoform X8 n=1 Tax=Epinephelus moara TaxID=300413 RepID=UPI00214E8DFC|nr:uncharacterized protein LOC126392119 isoform X8 [Epinephelus moara]